MQRMFGNTALRKSKVECGDFWDQNSQKSRQRRVVSCLADAFHPITAWMCRELENERDADMSECDDP